MLRRWLRWPHGFIAAFLFLQLLLPLHYYVAREDPNDERYAWRMFSPTRMTECSVAMTADGAPVDLLREFQNAWVKTAERGRRSVVEAMAAHLCRKHETVTASLTCTPIASRDERGPPPEGRTRRSHYRGTPYYMGGSFDLCTIPEL
jgi:hypothetical protein